MAGELAGDAAEEFAGGLDYFELATGQESGSTGHPGRVEKDVADVVGLLKANHLDVTSADWREIFLKYGPPELYEKLRKACQKPSP